MVCYFVSDELFFTSNKFQKGILAYVQSHAEICSFRERETKAGVRVLLTFDKVRSIQKALEIVREMDSAK